MIKSFAHKDTKMRFERRRSKRFSDVERVTFRKLVMLNAATKLADLELPQGNRLEAVKRALQV